MLASYDIVVPVSETRAESMAPNFTNLPSNVLKQICQLLIGSKKDWIVRNKKDEYYLYYGSFKSSIRDIMQLRAANSQMMSIIDSLDLRFFVTLSYETLHHDEDDPHR